MPVKAVRMGSSPFLHRKNCLGMFRIQKSFVDSLQVINIDSTNMQPRYWLMIAETIEKHYEDYDGFVVCHGTDTMAYTAAALSYLVQNSRKPIVVTGAQKPIDLEITDARTNLSDSLRFASCD